ncbi:MAG: hypothetical protein ACJ715_09985 [Ornithinibacter sp.]
MRTAAAGGAWKKRTAMQRTCADPSSSRSTVTHAVTAGARTAC